MSTASSSKPRRCGGSAPTPASGARCQAVSVLHAEGLRKTYQRRAVVNDVAVDLAQGEIVGLLGPNGAGKTTTFYLITGLIRPDRGTIHIDDADITGLPMYKRVRRGLGYLPQEPSIFRRMTVEQNVLAILEVLGLSRAERMRRLDSMLAELGLTPLRHAARIHAQRWRAPPARDHARAGDEPQVHAARRTVRRRRSDRRARHPDDRRLAAGPGHRRADHRPQRGADPGDRGPRLHHARGHGAGRRLRARTRLERPRRRAVSRPDADGAVAWPHGAARHEDRPASADRAPPGAADQPSPVPGDGHAVHADARPAAAPAAGAAQQSVPRTRGAGGRGRSREDDRAGAGGDQEGRRGRLGRDPDQRVRRRRASASSSNRCSTSSRCRSRRATSPITSATSCRCSSSRHASGCSARRSSATSARTATLTATPEQILESANQWLLSNNPRRARAEEDDAFDIDGRGPTPPTAGTVRRCRPACPRSRCPSSRPRSR